MPLCGSWLNLSPCECNGTLLVLQIENIALRRNASAVICSSKDIREDIFTVTSVKYCFKAIAINCGQ